MSFKTGDSVSTISGYRFNGVVISVGDTLIGNAVSVTVQDTNTGEIKSYLSTQLTKDTRTLSVKLREKLQDANRFAIMSIQSLGNLDFSGKEEHVNIVVKSDNFKSDNVSLVAIKDGKLIGQYEVISDDVTNIETIEIDMINVDIPLALLILDYIENV